jgi:hypothetical protein
MIGNATTAHITRRVIAPGKSFRDETPSRRAASLGEWSAPGGREIDRTTRGARVRERDAIESISLWFGTGPLSKRS